MEKIYANSEEKYLKAVVLYAIDSDDDTFLCYDADGTQKAYEDDYNWEELFLKGLIRVHLMFDGILRITNPVGITKLEDLGVLTTGLDLYNFNSPNKRLSIAFLKKESDDSSSGEMIPADHGNLNN